MLTKFTKTEVLKRKKKVKLFKSQNINNVYANLEPNKFRWIICHRNLHFMQFRCGISIHDNSTTSLLAKVDISTKALVKLLLLTWNILNTVKLDEHIFGFFICNIFSFIRKGLSKAIWTTLFWALLDLSLASSIALLKPSMSTSKPLSSAISWRKKM